MAWGFSAAAADTLGPGDDYVDGIDVNPTKFLIVKVTTVEGSAASGTFC